MSFFMILFYILSFLAVYVQVFLLVTFFENRKKIFIRSQKIDLDYYPEVSIIVPCYNEEKTVSFTVESLLSLDYQPEKLRIIVVDDGSRDQTWQVLQQYKFNSRVSIFRKENGGKHTALNYALARTKSEFVGCLDADSSVHPEALKRIISFFNKNEKTMAVAPSIVVSSHKKIIQYAQRAEYDMAHYTKKMLAFLGGIHVLPGPFSIFRKKVFNDLGFYRKSHHTEDQEIALRMHQNGYQMDHCPDAYVYTNTPDTVVKLYKQRSRWIYGFIKNAFDYRKLFFKSKHGSIGIFTLPSGFISIMGSLVLFFLIISRLSNFIQKKIIQIKTVGLGSFWQTNFSFDFFFVQTQTFLFISIILYLLVIFALLNGRKMIYGRKMFSGDMFIFIFIYSLVAPFWLMKACWNALASREPSWVAEKDCSLRKNSLKL